MSLPNTKDIREIYAQCNLCPRNCNANRFENKTNFCGIDEKFHIASIIVHTGEEPVLSGEKGVCNVFFTHCNLQCIYCQNYQISQNTKWNAPHILSLQEITEKIISILDTGITHLGFVSPSHQIVQMVKIIETLHRKNYFPVIIYNTNSYDKISTLKMIDPLIDIYLPDFKYANNDLAEKYSQAPHYKQIAINSIEEMVQQKGKLLDLDENGIATRGVIIRHLILPSHVKNSIAVLEQIKNHFGNKITLSVMSQYFPPEPVAKHPQLGRPLTENEYQQVLSKIDILGFENGFIQEPESAENYQPDFKKKNPFG